MQKLAVTIVLCVIATTLSRGQKSIVEPIQKLITKNEIEAHLSFLAADEMRGRDTGSPELTMAANYIRTYFKMVGLISAPGADNFFQPVRLKKSYPPTKAEATIGNEHFVLKENMLVLQGGTFNWSGDLVYVGYGSAEDLGKHDLTGKMVLALAGSREADNLNKAFIVSRDKYKLVMSKGAAGLVEVLTLPQVPWPALVNYFSQQQWGLISDDASTTFPHIWLKPSDVKALSFNDSDVVKGTIAIDGLKPEAIPGRNVAGFIEGNDTRLKNEFVIITAHYDHIGVQPMGEGQDSIFNGARDNAIGTVALLQTAKYLAQYPPKRSVIIMALTSEEKGLLGSQWYVDHPLVQLSKHVLNINCDGVGYNDKSRITSISFGRTNLDDHIVRAAKTFGLEAGGDPDPKENFYERSDQVSFAKKGIPAIKLQPGLSSMDDEIRKYYHRAADEVGSLDFDYLTTFYRTFVYTVSLLVNDPQRPAWKSGDKFEEVSKALYAK
ncbi:MAG: M28 family peptidase [Cyclobacteriaceae bacterium]|nr:M28 family peptidase [Cyclobacteriaceae bacterium]